MSLAGSLVKRYLRGRERRIQHAIDHPLETQHAVLRGLVQAAVSTEWGRGHDYASIRDVHAFQHRVPINDYETLKPYIHRMMRGEPNVLWRGKTRQFSKSSGTTQDKSKFIPVTPENFKGCHLKGPKDTLALWYRDHPDSNLLGGKGVIMGGSVSGTPDAPDAIVGDISALMMKGMPSCVRRFQTPSREIALLPDWGAKLAQMVEVAPTQNVTNISGVPTWTLVLLQAILEKTGAADLLEVFPSFELYLHGGVNFVPYENRFRELFPSDGVHYREVYNASEGYFATRHRDGDQDMLLLLDNGVFYEFVPLSQWGGDAPKAVDLEGVQVGPPYVMLVSTNAGLWRYAIGDTVEFTSTSPYKLKVVGRTAHFINAFGEEVMVANTDRALAMTCQALQATVTEYTAGPIYPTADAKGGHEWLIEFARAPRDLQEFSQLLDRNLQSVNSDYEAKRTDGIALQSLTLHAVPPGTFHGWLAARGKSGGQNKVPRLANHRRFLDEVQQFSRRPHS